MTPTAMSSTPTTKPERGGDDLRAPAVLADRPDDCGEDAAAVERRARQQVEDAEHEIDEADVERDRGQEAAVAG